MSVYSISGVLYTHIGARNCFSNEKREWMTRSSPEYCTSIRVYTVYHKQLEELGADRRVNALRHQRERAAKSLHMIEVVAHVQNIVRQATQWMKWFANVL